MLLLTTVLPLALLGLAIHKSIPGFTPLEAVAVLTAIAVVIALYVMSTRTLS